MKINITGRNELERFDNAVKKMLTISREELQRRLDAEERAKKKRKAVKPYPFSRAFGEGT